MDLMYILGKGSTNDNFELRMALRSVSKNVYGIDRVFVVGENPGFLSDKVIYVPCNDKKKTKHANMLYKVQWCVDHTDIGSKDDLFLVSSDDIFVNQKTYLPIPCYHQGQLEEAEGVKPGSYAHNLKNTRAFLKRYNLPTYKFAIHAIHVFSRSIIKENEALISKAYDDRWGIEPNCLVNNLMLKKDPNLKKEYLVDNKIVYTSDEVDFRMKTARKLFFSCNDDSLKNGGMEVIGEYWPNKSKWEK